MVANGEEDAIFPDSGEQLLNKERQQSRAYRGQVEVVDHKQRVELERREVLHDGATTEDDHVVGDQHRGGGADVRQRRFALDELELAGRIADNILEGLVKNGPELDAERPIDCRQGHVLQQFSRHGELSQMNN